MFVRRPVAVKWNRGCVAAWREQNRTLSLLRRHDSFFFFAYREARGCRLSELAIHVSEFWQIFSGAGEVAEIDFDLYYCIVWILAPVLCSLQFW